MSDTKFEPFFDEGKAAYVPKQKPDCPYPDGTHACSIWWKGFRKARASVKKKEKAND